MIDYVLLEKYTKDMSVLFIEDDESIRVECTELLNDIFTSVDVAIDGKKGLHKYLDYYNKNKCHYDLVLTDIRMPKMDGIELTKHIYKENKKQVLIVLSAHNETDDLMKLINLGITQFILKPMDIDNFIDVIYKISKEIFYEKNSKSIEKSNFIFFDEDLYWNIELKQLFKNKTLIKLTKKELLLINLLLKSPEKTYSNEEIISVVWDIKSYTTDLSNLKNLLSRLKRKVPTINIENIYSFGYRLIIRT